MARWDFALSRRATRRLGREDDRRGVHAAFDDPLEAVAASLELQRGLAESQASCGLALSVRCGLHLGMAEHRDNEFFGTPVNRAARLMAVAHGRQLLLSQAVAGSARAAMGDDSAFDSAWQEGRAMTLEKAIDYALDEPDGG